jgi:hypothetical protein
MHISVTVDSISKTNFQEILDYYNTNKPNDEELLERLDRFEGGFQIEISQQRNKCIDENNKIRQLRWSRGKLVSGCYIGFTEKQLLLLYDAMVYILPGCVILEN